MWATLRQAHTAAMGSIRVALNATGPEIASKKAISLACSSTVVRNCSNSGLRSPERDCRSAASVRWA